VGSLAQAREDFAGLLKSFQREKATADVAELTLAQAVAAAAVSFCFIFEKLLVL
jgi:hypothetical protein